jgi:hypothetical protein
MDCIGCFNYAGSNINRCNKTEQYCDWMDYCPLEDEEE